MIAKVSSNPALGYETVISHSQTSVCFSVCLAKGAASSNDWEVEIWHNLRDEWEALPLERTSKKIFEIRQTGSGATNHWFTGELVGKPSQLRPVSFTIRFRPKSQNDFIWEHDQSGAADGKLLYQPPLSSLDSAAELSTFLKGIGGDLHVERIRSDTSETCLWSISAKAVPASGDEPGWTTHELGEPLHYARWFALTRISGMWLGPRHGRGLPYAEKDAILYAFLRLDGLCMVLLAISGVGGLVTLLQQRGGGLGAYTRNDSDQDGTARVAVVVGASFEEASAAAIYYARRLVSRTNSADEEAMQLLAHQKVESNAGSSEDFRANWVEDWNDGFTYCTWNGLGLNLSEERIVAALDSFKQNGVNVTNLIIDDGWQSLDHPGERSILRGWADFEADPQGFPNKLGQMTAELHRRFPALKHIAVWHALLGYWGGIALEGKIAQKYQTVEMTKPQSSIGNTLRVVDAPEVARLFDDFYSFLTQSGVNSVKTDVQYYLEDLGPTPARHRLTNAYYSAWMIAQLRHFGGRAISCMSQSPTIIFRCQLPHDMPAMTVRNSDDFFPEIKASHPWHIFCNAHNALLSSRLNVLPDWDMFQTGHEWASFHAAARCVSGGPIYVTDVPGKHDVGLIEEMTAKTVRGQTVVLRCSCVGQSAQVFTGFEEERLCIVAAYHGAKGTGAGVLGIFNCLETEVTQVLPLNLFRGLEECTPGYISRSHRTGAVSGILYKDCPNSVTGLTFKSYGWDIVTAVPITELVLPAHSEIIRVANFGLLGKMSGVAALLSSAVDVDFPGKRIRIITRLKALGKLGLWISALQEPAGLHEIALKNNLMVEIGGRPIPWECVGIGHRGEAGGILEIDVDTAWRKMGLSAGWSNEVEVVVFFRINPQEKAV